VRLLGKLAGRDPKLVDDTERARPAASEVDRLWADSALAREILGWAPQTSLDDGLRQTIAWVESHEDYYGFAGYHR
jgi:dTDP-glucose 4,6-dehydratase